MENEELLSKNNKIYCTESTLHSSKRGLRIVGVKITYPQNNKGIEPICLSLAI